MRQKYLRELENLGRSAWQDDCKTIGDLRNRIKEIFKKDSDDYFDKVRIKLAQEETREQLNAN